jgi:hypothetical protein
MAELRHASPLVLAYTGLGAFARVERIEGAEAAASPPAATFERSQICREKVVKLTSLSFRVATRV